ncbi:MAG: hypothetical protein JJ992_10865 [Planctomycetes bacterium]|nr:hypothetical protein [Planctomycetota bacterium]
MVLRITTWIVAAGLWAGCMNSSSAQEPDWRGVIVARGETRQEIESTDILVRPYRPLHFYGNTLRRRYYRGWATPLPQDVVQGARAFVRRR